MRFFVVPHVVIFALAVLLLVVIVILSIAGCGDDGSEDNIGPQLNLPDDARIVIRKIPHPETGVPVYCVVATSANTEARAVSLSCDWP